MVFVGEQSKDAIEEGYTEDTIRLKKKSDIKRAAETYLYANGLEDVYCRVDVVSIIWDNGKGDITLYQDAIQF